MATRFTESFPRLAEMVPPEQVAADETDFKRISASLNLLVIGSAAFAIFYGSLGIYEVAGALAFGTLLAGIARASYQKFPVARPAIAELGVLLVCAELTMGNIYTGGFFHPHFCWFILIPAGTSVIIGHWVAVRWTFIVCVITIGFWSADAMGVEFINRIPPAHQKIHALINVLAATITLGSLVWMFVRSRAAAETRALAAQKALLKERERLRVLAHFDSLTTLPNRNSFEQALEKALRRGNNAALIYLDLDRFRDVNDAFGHAIGDTVLVEAARRFARVVYGNSIIPEHTEVDSSESPLLARRGGDEFVVLMPEASGAEAAHLAQRLLRALQEPIEFEAHRLHVAVSVGIALAPNDGDDVESLVRSADIALARVKTRGTGGVDFFEDEALQTLRRRVLIETALRDAIELDELRLAYQPLFDIEGNIVGAEALLRWHSAVLGPVSPGEFIPIAERSGQMRSLGDWVVREACEEAKRWPEHVRVSVNVSVAQLRGAALVGYVETVLSDTGLTAARLELEITESLLADDAYTRSVIDDLRGLGVGIALDDFGTGFSSLGVLRKLPVDRLKIDQSFVQSMHHDAGDAALVRTIVAMGRELGLHVLAEGVEIEEQLIALKKIGCDEVQGYHLSRPIKPAEFRAMMKEEAVGSKIVPLPKEVSLKQNLKDGSS